MHDVFSEYLGPDILLFGKEFPRFLDRNMKTRPIAFQILISAFFVFPAHQSIAADTYNTGNGVLTVAQIAVGDTLYTNVRATIGQVISVGTASSDTYSKYVAATNRLTIPSVTIGTTTYYTVVVSLTNVLSVGSTCAGLTACLSDSGTTTSSTLYSAPATFESIVKTSYQPSGLTSATTFVSRNRYLISDAQIATSSSNYLSIGSTYSATTGYAVESSTIPSASTYSTYLNKLVHVVPDSYGYYRLESHLHPNNAIDFDATDSNALKFRNSFGKVSKYFGYLTFAYDSSTKLLQAKKRYSYSTTSATSNNNTTYTGIWTEDSSFSTTAQNYYVAYTGGSYKLVAASDSASKFYLFDSPMDMGVPSFMNPKAISYVSNGAAPFVSKTTVAATEGTSGSIYRQVNSTYRPQVLAAGTDATTKTNAESMLETIKTTVESSGETLRYSTTVYKTFRNSLLATKLVSDSISDGTPGQNLVPYVYFTNEKDTTTGKYHPFMIIVSYGNQASPNGLIDVPHPPGDGSGGYASSKVTRFSNLENYVIAIPMKDYGQVSLVTENVLSKSLWSDVANTSLSKDVYTYASTADNGILFNGAVMFPAFNNTLVPSHLFGELSPSGCHVGQGGGGPHCHMDSYQSSIGLGLYNDADYVGKTHPPLIGFGYDGIALFGRYRTTTDSSLLGYSTALDSFGAHNHDAIGYHYHAHWVENYTSSAGTYSMPVLMKGAYIGKIGSIPYFGTNSNFSANKYLGGTVP